MSDVKRVSDVKSVCVFFVTSSGCMDVKRVLDVKRVSDVKRECVFFVTSSG